MKNRIKHQLLEQLIFEEQEIKSELKLRKSQFEFLKILNKKEELLQKSLNNSWEVDCKFKTITRLRKQKMNSHFFRDSVWSLFASLGFDTLNKEQFIDIPYDKKDFSLTQKFDVFVKDPESILLVKCESSEKNTKSNFREYLESIKGNILGIRKTLNFLYPGVKPKIKFVLATQNYVLTTEDKDILEQLKGVHFTEDTIDYFDKMYFQIGLAARYQLLGFLFRDMDISEMENRIPAIRGKMGGHVYYSFSIEPEKLLKIAYVLHRTQANSNMMPTYQRIIQKTRLRSIYKFLDEEKGYFPNSIIINLNSGKKRNLNFKSLLTLILLLQMLVFYIYLKDICQLLLSMGNIAFMDMLIQIIKCLTQFQLLLLLI